MFVILFFSCNSKPIDFKEGKFNLYINDSLSRITERKGSYQLEYSPDKENSEIGLIEWQGDSLYSLRGIVSSDSLDTDRIFVKIDSIINKTAYLNAYKKGVDFNLICRMVKTDDKIGDEFKELLKKDLPVLSK